VVVVAAALQGLEGVDLAAPGHGAFVLAAQCEHKGFNAGQWPLELVQALVMGRKVFRGDLYIETSVRQGDELAEQGVARGF
jgi:hypothetical protein